MCMRWPKKMAGGAKRAVNPSDSPTLMLRIHVWCWLVVVVNGVCSICWPLRWNWIPMPKIILSRWNPIPWWSCRIWYVFSRIITKEPNMICVKTLQWPTRKGRPLCRLWPIRSWNLMSWSCTRWTVAGMLMGSAILRYGSRCMPLSSSAVATCPMRWVPCVGLLSIMWLPRCMCGFTPTSLTCLRSTRPAVARPVSAVNPHGGLSTAWVLWPHSAGAICARWLIKPGNRCKKSSLIINQILKKRR